MVRNMDLRRRRVCAEQAFSNWQDSGSNSFTQKAPPEILASWERSANAIRSDITEAPTADPDATNEAWEVSPMQQAVARLEGELRRVADDGDLVVAVTDPRTRILWTCSGREMRRRAERVNFVVGGKWDEQSVGTNALNLALRVDRAVEVFSAEHFAPIVHDWACWAAPVHDPVSGKQLGVLDLSTTWDRAHPIGTVTARVLARLLEREIGLCTPAPDSATLPGVGLKLRLLGTPEVRLDGNRLFLTRRQTEILALLALHPNGLQLVTLHAMIYGDARISTSTLKTEVSHLRAALGGRLASRPYRLTLPVTCDVAEVLEGVRRGDVRAAVATYGGELLPGTESPALAEMANYVAVAIRENLLADPQPDAVLKYAECVPYDLEVLERALAALGDSPLPARALLRARLHAGARD